MNYKDYQIDYHGEQVCALCRNTGMIVVNYLRAEPVRYPLAAQMYCICITGVRRRQGKPAIIATDIPSWENESELDP